MSTNRAVRKVFYVVLGLIIIVLVLQLALNFYINRRLAGDLRKLVSEGTDGRYNLELRSAVVNLFNRSVVLNEPALIPVPCSTCAATTFQIKANSVSLTGVNVLHYLRTKKLEAAGLGVDELSLGIHRPARVIENDTTNHRLSLYKILSPKLKELLIREIELENTVVQVYNGISDTSLVLASDDCDISIQKFLFNKQVDSLGNLFLSEKFNMTLKSFTYKLPAGLYTLRGKNMVSNYNDSLISVDSLELIPRYDKKKFDEVAGRQVSRVKLKLSNIVFSKINPKLFYERSWFVSKKLSVDFMNIDIYRDMNKVYKPKKKPTIQEILRQIPFFVKIDTVDVKNSFIGYSQLAKEMEQPGRIEFHKLQGKITGLRNDSSSYHGKEIMEMRLSSYFMNKGKIIAVYYFPLNTDKDVYDCKGRMGPMSLTETNKVLENLANISIKSGRADSVLFSFHSDGSRCSGQMKFLYHDLSVELINREGKKAELKKRVVSFFADKFVVKDENPKKGKEPRISKIEFERDPNRFLFYNTWKALQSGLFDAIGLKNAELFINRAVPK